MASRSPFGICLWKHVNAVRVSFLNSFFEVGIGLNIHFYHDSWSGNGKITS